MLVALFIGNHGADTLAVRLGWAFTRLVQRGKYKSVTHVEAIHKVHSDGSVTIASASIRDGGVRTKRNVNLTPGHWLIVDVPAWGVGKSAAWFSIYNGLPYDWRGAVATVLPGTQNDTEWFCNEAVGASVGLVDPQIFGPAQFATICMTMGHDVTDEFFKIKE